jgi:hypothetical protein
VGEEAVNAHITNKTSSQTRIAYRRVQVVRRYQEKESIAAIAADLGVALPTVYNDLDAMGIKRKRCTTGARAFDKAAAIKEKRFAKAGGEVKDRRRFKTVTVPMGSPSVIAAANATRSLFARTRVFEPTSQENVLKDGSNNSKIGGDVLVGRLKGARIYTLTLEERATCPTNCELWRGCYGNSMQHSRRWKAGPALEAAVADELGVLCSMFEKVLVRLHILGDFYSVEYVGLWYQMLKRHPNLFLFGFTAHTGYSKTGKAIAAMRDAYPNRVFMRQSGSSGPWGSFTIDFPTEKTRFGDAVVCPEQRDAMNGKQGMHCGSCGLCWAGSTPIVFCEH